ncbi:HTH domain-containing protein [Marinifilum fragile]|uniref:HTH domain-containing protein n=1 Tax=Marinifilum fragile TaxID=570161 RepID=UPI0038995350
MKTSDNPEVRNRILKLAKNHASGTPEQLASKLGCSGRTINRIIADMRNEGINIAYSRTLESYILD